MDSPTRVSIALATCEGEAFIEEQLESLARQTRPPDEVVVSDDASTDETCARVEAFAARAPFDLRLERNPARLGITANFGRALARCRGDVIFFCDQDDWWLPEKIERMTEILEGDERIGAVLCNARVVGAEREPLGHDVWRAVGFDAAEQAAVRAGQAPRVFMRHVVAAGMLLAFRSRYRDLYLPLPDLRSAHDAWVAFLIASVAPFVLVDELLAEHRLHGANRFGFRLFDLRAQYGQAKRQVAEEAFRHAASFFRQARARLVDWSVQAEDRDAVSPALVRDLDEKIAHAERRDAMSPALLSRLPAILQELSSGRYRRYSYGWKSLAQDLFLR